MEEKAEAVQERGLQRKTNFRVLPRGDPSMGDQKSKNTQQKTPMLPLHETVPAVDRQKRPLLVPSDKLGIIARHETCGWKRKPKLCRNLHTKV